MGTFLQKHFSQFLWEKPKVAAHASNKLRDKVEKRKCVVCKVEHVGLETAVHAILLDSTECSKKLPLSCFSLIALSIIVRIFLCLLPGF